MVNKKSIIILTIITLILALYVFLGISSQIWLLLPRRFKNLRDHYCLYHSISTVIFQAFTNNRILTPNMLGFDSIYVNAISSHIYSWLGSFLIVNQYANFITSLVVMVTLSTLLYGVLFKRWGIN